MSAGDWTWVQQHQLAIAAYAPLLAAVLAVAAPGRTLPWLIALVGAGAGCAASISAAWDALVLGRGGGLSHDGVAAFAAPLLAINLMAAAIGAGGLMREVNARAAPYAFALTMAVGGAWTGALFADRLTETFVCVLTASVACVALTALADNRDRGALNGALRMYAACGVSAALMLLGVGLVERGAGIATLQDLPLTQIAAPDMALAGVALIFVAIAWQVGLAPLNTWGGVAFARGGRLAPLMLGAVHLVGGVAVMVRIGGFALQAPAIGTGVAAVMAGLGAAALLVSSLQAIGASAVNRLAACCVSAHAGGVLIAAALGSNAGFSAAFLQMLALSATACALFCAAAMIPRDDGEGLEALDGLFRRAPVAAATLALVALSAMGAPLTIGFLARWRLMEAGIGAGWWWTLPSAVIASLAGVFYGGRMIERMFLRRRANAALERPDRWRLLLAPGALAGVAAIAFAVSPQWVLASAATAADMVMRGAP